MSIGAGGSHNKSASQSWQTQNSISGLRDGLTSPMSRDLYNVGHLNSVLAQRFATAAPGTFMGRSIDQLAPVNQYGLPVETTNAIASMAKDLYSNASAGGALRGQLTPEATPGVIGDTLNRLGAQLIPQITSYAQYRQGLPESMMASRLGFLQNTSASNAPLLGSQSSYSGGSWGKSSGTQANAQLGLTPGG